MAMGFNGSKWTAQPLLINSRSYLQGVSCDATGCLAVGYLLGHNHFEALTERGHDGTGWSLGPTGQPAGQPRQDG